MQGSSLVVGVVVLGLVRVASAEPTTTCKVPAAGTKLTVTLSPETSLRDLATWVSGFTCKNVVFSTDVAKHATRVTVVSSKSMTPKQAERLFVDTVEATGLVVVQKPDTFVIKLGKDMPRGCPDLAEATRGPDATSLDPAPADDDLAAVIAAGVREIDPTTREIRTEVVDRILADPVSIAKGARIVPAMTNGKPSGFKLYAVRPSSLYAKLGLANGDTITAINGQALTSADQALEVYAKIRDATRLEVSVIRRDKPLRLVWLIKR